MGYAVRHASLCQARCLMVDRCRKGTLYERYCCDSELSSRLNVPFILELNKSFTFHYGITQSPSICSRYQSLEDHENVLCIWHDSCYRTTCRGRPRCEHLATLRSRLPRMPGFRRQLGSDTVESRPQRVSFFQDPPDLQGRRLCSTRLTSAGIFPAGATPRADSCAFITERGTSVAVCVTGSRGHHDRVGHGNIVSLTVRCARTPYVIQTT